MKRVIQGVYVFLLLACGSMRLQAQINTGGGAVANRLFKGTGAPSGGCAVTGDVGKVYVQNNVLAGTSPEYLCSQTASGVYGWVNSGTSSGGSGTVTSIAGGCSLAGGTITVSGTLSQAEPTDPQTSSGAFAIPSSDCGKAIQRNNASAVSDTLAQAGTGAFTSGWFVDYQCMGAGGCTITPTTSTIGGGASLVLTQNLGVRIISTGANYGVQGSTASGGLSAIGNASVLGNVSGGSATPAAVSLPTTANALWKSIGANGQPAASSVVDNATTVSTTLPFSAGSISTGTSPPALTSGSGGAQAFNCGTVPTVGPATGVYVSYCDGTFVGRLVNRNNLGYLPEVLGPVSVTGSNIPQWTSEGILGAGFALGTNVQTFLTTPSPTNFNSAMTGPVQAGTGGTGVVNTATLTLGSSNQNWATIGTGIVKVTTTTGAISDATSADILAACTTCVVASAPGVGIAHFAGSTQTATSSAVNLAGADVANTLGVGNGGSGATTLTAHGPLVGEATSAIVATSPGTSGQCYLSNGVSADPSFQACPGGSGAGNSVTSTTPITVNTNTTSDQQLMELSLGAGYFNSAKQPFLFDGAGIYSTQTAQTPTLTLKIKLCTISGCGSGTVVTLISIVSTATIAAVANNNWNLSILGYTATTGSTGNLEIHGPLAVDLGALTTAADSVFVDTNTATSSNIDLTAALFVDFTIAFSTNAVTANTFTQRSGGVMPFAATAGAAGCTPGGSTGDLQQNGGSGNCVASPLNSNGTLIKSTEPITMGPTTVANGISVTATANSSGVTANLLAAKDTGNPTAYQTSASGGCGSGIAASTATSGIFELFSVPGLVYTGVADNTITAGHILVGGITTPGRVSDSGQTGIGSISGTTCIVGIAEANATTGSTVLFRYFGPGLYGASVVTTVNHTIGATFVNGGSALSGTTVSCQPIPIAGTILGVYATADVSGLSTIGIATTASYTGIAGYSGYTSIVASAPPSLSSAVSYHDATLTGWSKTLTAGQYMCIQLSSPATVSSVNITILYSGSN